MRECPAIARAEIKRLQAKGINPTLDEIVWLASLGAKVERPHRELNPLMSGAPVVAGSEPFFPLTNQAAWWLDQARQWFGGNGLCHVIGYAHRHGRIPGHFAELMTPRAAVEAVNKWCHGLAITDDEMMTAAEALADNDAPTRPATDQDTEPETHYSEMLARAIAATGLPRDYWETATPEEMGDVLAEAIRLTAAGSGVDASATASASGEALRDLLFAVQEIEARRNGQ